MKYTSPEMADATLQAILTSACVYCWGEGADVESEYNK